MPSSISWEAVHQYIQRAWIAQRSADAQRAFDGRNSAGRRLRHQSTWRGICGCAGLDAAALKRLLVQPSSSADFFPPIVLKASERGAIRTAGNYSCPMRRRTSSNFFGNHGNCGLDRPDLQTSQRKSTPVVYRSRRFIELPVSRVAYVERGRGPAGCCARLPVERIQWRERSKAAQNRRCIAELWHGFTQTPETQAISQPQATCCNALGRAAYRFRGPGRKRQRRFGLATLCGNIPSACVTLR